MGPTVDLINREWARLQSVSEEELKGQTVKFRSIITDRTATAGRPLVEVVRRALEGAGDRAGDVAVQLRDKEQSR